MINQCLITDADSEINAPITEDCNNKVVEILDSNGKFKNVGVDLDLYKKCVKK